MAHKLGRVQAKQLYIEEGKTVEEIAKLLPDISEKSIYRWKAEEDWDKQREEIALTSVSASKQMLQTLTEQLKVMMDEIKETKKINPANVYAIRQLLLSVKSLQKDVDHYGNILLAMQELTAFLSDRDPEMLDKLQELFIEFGSAMSKKYGKK